jgi:hypothetical protein
MGDMKLLVENARLAGPQRTRPTATSSSQQAASAQRSQLTAAGKMGNSKSAALGKHGREGSALHPP